MEVLEEVRIAVKKNDRILAPLRSNDTPAKTTQCGQSEEKATPTRLDDCMLSQGKPTQDMPMTRTRMNTYS